MRIAWSFAALAACLIVFVVAGWLIRRGEGPSVVPVEPVDSSLPGVEATDAATQVREIKTVQMGPKVLLTERELTPSEVLDSPDCTMRIGTGPASNLAIVVVPSSNGARFSVLDGTGALYVDTLPFVPNHYKLGKRADGLVVAGFGDLRLNQKGNRGRESAEPVRIYMGGQIIYEHEKIWWFGIANDGSSFSVIEPLGGKTSRLVVSNLDDGTESHHDLGDIYGSEGYELPYGTSYSLNNDELHLTPASGMLSHGIGLHYFYPVDSGGDIRRVRVDKRGVDDSAYLISSKEGYFVYGEDGGAEGPYYRILRRRLGWSTGKTEDVWSWHVRAKTHPGGIALSDDGAWLKVSTSPLGLPGAWDRKAFRTYVLNTSTGEVVFEFPQVDKEAQFRRLTSVMASGAMVEDVGEFGGASIYGGKLMMFRTFPDATQPDGYRGVFDVFDMSTLAIDSQPDFRVAVNSSRSNPCPSRSFPRSLNVQEDGRLAYAVVR